MQTLTFQRSLRSVLLSSVCLIAAPSSGFAQVGEQDGAGAESGDMIYVVGTRRPVGSAKDTPSPVDNISAAELAKQASSDVSDLLRVAVPSFNVNTQAVGGVASFVRPATLRGLSPDSTLILVNGKRRHRGSVIVNYAGGFDNGSQPPDISSIPSIALDSVQVLRDGASAQYGSDAVAGVINFVLADDDEGVQAYFRVGQTYEGDGDSQVAAARLGLPLGEGGHATFSLEWSNQDATSRTIQRDSAAALIAAGNTAVPTPTVDSWGQLNVDDNFKAFANFGVEAFDGSELYGFANFASRESDGPFVWRDPNNRNGVYTFSQDGVRYRLVGDMTPDDTEVCPGAFNFITNEDPVTAGTAVIAGTPEDAALITALGQLPNCYAVNEVLPGGFNPRFTGEVTEAAGTFGFRGELVEGLDYDLSYSIGRHRSQYGFDLTVNPSLGAFDPLMFDDVGAYVNTEQSANLDLVYPLDISAFASPLNIAGGVEWREERFDVELGQTESWDTGVLATQGFSVGTNGFGSFDPNKEGSFSRNSYAAYLDLEADVHERFTLGAAVRYEDFSDFGDATSYKVAGLLRVTDALSIRSTYTTGFRAPTIGQANFRQATSSANADGTLSVSGQIPPTNPISRLRGGEELQPETSDSVTAGVVIDTGLFTLTADAYRIEVDDRITQSRNFSLTDEETTMLIADGFPAAGDFESFNFFTNDFSTTTKGVDLVLTVPLSVTQSGDTTFGVSANYTDTEITSIDPGDPLEPISETRRIQLEEGFPNYKGTAQLSHVEEKWRGLARLNFHGPYTELFLRAGSLPIEAEAEVLLDLEFGYSVTDQLELVVGAENVLNDYPTDNPYSNRFGAEYGETPPFGYRGGFFYFQVNAEF